MEKNHIVHLFPTDQPSTVREIAQHLLDDYEIEGGSKYLAGCTLENRPFVRVRAEERGQAIAVYVDRHGREVAPEEIERLSMGHELAEGSAPPETQHGVDVGPMVEAAQRLLAARLGVAQDAMDAHPAVLWFKYAAGKIRFTFDVGLPENDSAASLERPPGEEETMVDIPFSGWTPFLTAPWYVCPHTQRKTKRLALTDDGRIAAAEEIGTCVVTQRRVLARELATCASTGQRVLADLLAPCPVSGEMVLPSELTQCTWCEQEVSPPVVEHGRCAACRALARTRSQDEPVASLLERHPSWRRYRTWRVAATERYWVVQGNGLLHQMLAVVDRTSGEVLRLATKGRFSRQWKPLEGPAGEQPVNGPPHRASA